MGLYDDLTTQPAGPTGLYDDLLPQVAPVAAGHAAGYGQIGAPGADPSEGGGTFQFGPLDTGIHTPQWLDRTLAGAGRGLLHTGRSVGNMLGLVPDQVLNDEKAVDAPLMGTTAGQVGNLIGESAATAPLGIGAGSVMSKAPLLADSALASSLLQGGIQGAATADPGQHGAGALTGALTGALLTGAGKVGGKLVNGLTRSDAAQRLLEEGIDLTPGQMNPQGVFNQFEQATESVPGVRQLIEPSRDAAEHQYQALVISKGAAPGATVNPSGSIHDMLQQAYDSYAPLYDQAKGYPVTPEIWSTGQNIPLSTAFTKAAQAPGVPGSIQKSEGAWLSDRLSQLPQNPTSDDLLDLRSAIRQRAREFNLKTDTNAAHIANINSRADQAVTASLTSQLPPAPLQALQTADSNYGNYKLIESAVAKSKDNLAGLTPQKLSQAIYDSIPDGAYARGAGGQLRDLARAGADVFQNVSPPTGARVATLGGAAIAGATHPLVAIPTGTGMLAAVATPTGRALAQGATAPQQAAQKLGAALSAAANQSKYTRGAADAALQLLGRGATGAMLPITQQAAPAALAGALMYGQNALGAQPAAH